MGELVRFPSHRIVRESLLTKHQLAARYGRTTRWVERQMKQGMPSELHGIQRRFRLSEVEAWRRATS